MFSTFRNEKKWWKIDLIFENQVDANQKWSKDGKKKKIETANNL